DWWVTHNIMEYSVREWRDVRHMSYAAISLFQLNTLRSTQAGQDYIAQLQHVKDFVSPPRYGEPIIVYALHKMDEPTHIQFGDRILLSGYDYSAKSAAPGGRITLRFYWQAITRPTANYSVYVHLAPENARQPVAQADGSPAHVDRPSLTWDDPDETLLSE